MAGEPADTKKKECPPVLATPCCEGLISSHMVARGTAFSLLRCEESHKRLDSGFAVAVRGAARGGPRELKHTALPRRYSRALAQTALAALLKDVRGSEDLTKTLAQIGQGLPMALESIFTLTLGAGQLSVALVPTLHHVAAGNSSDVAIWSAMAVTPGGATRVFCCPGSASPSDFIVAYFSELMEHKAPIWYSRIFSIGDDGMLLGVADGGSGRRIVFGRGINCRCVDAQDAMRRPNIMVTLIADTAHDAYCMVDAGLVLAYIRDSIPGWRAYVDHLSKRGKRFFVTPRIVDALEKMGVTTSTLPPHFHTLNVDHEECEHRVEKAYPLAKERLHLHSDEYETELKWILGCGYSICSSEECPLDAIFKPGMCVAMTRDDKAMRRLLGTAAKRAALEDAVNLHALEHLATFRFVGSRDGSFVDVHV